MSIPLLILALLGLLLFAFADGKASEVGRLIFFAAALALCLGGTSSHWLRLTT